MSDATTRRAALKYGGGGALALLIGGVAGWLDRRDHAGGPDAAASVTTTTAVPPAGDDCATDAVIEGIGPIDAAIITLGAALVGAHGWSDLDALLADLPAGDGDPLERAAAITAAEFRAGDTVSIDGWVLARSEARAAAALALMERTPAC